MVGRAPSSRSVSGRLPAFPWDHLVSFADRARAHPGGIVDLSVGTPVDPSPEVARTALAAAADAPGYPMTIGRPETRQAVLRWLSRRCGVEAAGLDGVLPVVGSKELIASLALHLGVGPGDLVVHPELAYPTYEVGAALAGARTLATDSLEDLEHEDVALLWLNSPANPTGRVLPVEHLRAVVAWCRARGTLLVSDECYLEFAWEPAHAGDPGGPEGPVGPDGPGGTGGRAPVSVLHPDVCDGDHTGLLAVHSLSKRSNLAGYRCAFVAGDPAVVGELLAVRKNLGLQMPGPQQVAMAAVLDDDDHVAAQWERYRARRALIREALVRAGFRIDHSQGSLYLWATRDEPCWDSVSWLADRGVLVAPGAFYGPAGARHVRVAFTATDERVAAAVARLAS